MGKASGIAWTAIFAEFIMGAFKVIGSGSGWEVHFGVVPLCVAIVALVAIAIVSTEW